MASYSAVGRTPAGTNLTILLINSAAAVVGKINQLIVGSDSAPADIATRFDLIRSTAAATGGTPITTKATDPQAVASSCTVLAGTFSGEPTYEASFLLEIALNQRATFTWIANPGREFRTTVGTANGIGLRSIASGAVPNVNATFVWDE